MKNNSVLHSDVQNAIKWESLLNAVEIAVTYKEDLVIFEGTVDSYAKKMEVGNASKRAVVVSGLVDDIEVRFLNPWINTNLEIVEETLSALKSNWAVPKHKIIAKVEHDSITLDDELLWNTLRIWRVKNDSTLDYYTTLAH